MKKATDYVIGDWFLDGDEYDAGAIVSLMVDPNRQSRALILVCSDQGTYTIYSCPRDAVSKASLARNIPEPVMRKFLFDVYLDGNELTHTPGATRVPVRLPEYKPAKSVRPTLVPSVVDREAPELVMVTELVDEDNVPVPVPDVVPEDAGPGSVSDVVPDSNSVPGSAVLLPEVDFP